MEQSLSCYKTLEEWAEENPDTNPFEGCENIDAYGGSELLYEEFLYRYSDLRIFRERAFIPAIQRLFKYNRPKYARLLASLNATYNVFDNYRVEKTGKERTDIDKEYPILGGYTVTPTLTHTTQTSSTQNRTPNLTEQKNEEFGEIYDSTETPDTVETSTVKHGAVQQTETSHPDETVTESLGVSTTIAETGTNENENVRTPETTTITNTTQAGYHEIVNTGTTTYNNSSIHPVSQSETTHSPVQGQDERTTVSFGTGSKETVAEDGSYSKSTVTSHDDGVNTTVKSYDDNTVVTVKFEDPNNKFDTTKVETEGTITGESSKTGENVTTIHNTGSETTTISGTNSTTTGGSTQTTYNNYKKSEEGFEELSFTGRVDEGYMYRPPQDAIEDEIKIARHNLLTIILKDVRDRVLISVYPNTF